MRRLVPVLASVLLVACGSGGQHLAAQAAADATTKAVYADDYDGVTTHFDSELKSQVTRAEVGILSDKLHSLGTYSGITYVDGDPLKGEYTYRLGFQHGTMTAVVRVDSDGSLSAYRLFAQS